MALIDLIKRELIKVPLTATDKQGVITELIDLLDEAGVLLNREDALGAIQQREALGSTGLEKGIAIPHAKTEAVKSITLALGISPGGVDYQALDGKPSTMFFCILAPRIRQGLTSRRCRRLPR